jgi:nitrite reductase (NO-forming)
MPATLERPTIVPIEATPAPRTPPPEPPRRPPTSRSFFDRYQQHLWIGAVSLVVILVAVTPLVADLLSRRAGTTASSSAVQLVTITASEFKFVPSSVPVAAGQKVTFTLDNKGVVEHDITIPATGFTLFAKAGQVASGDTTFDTPGTYEFICSIPGHKEAGMKGTLTVGTPSAAAAAVAPSAAMNLDMSAPDIKPLPANLAPLPAPQVAPPINRTEPAYVTFDLTTQKATARMADGVAYEYWTFNGTVPGPMLRVREGDTVEIDIGNAADAGVTHSIDLHAVTGPGGGAAVTQIAPGDNASFTFKALNPGVYVYHCATPMVAHHIASGMYGLIVVEPASGLPAVDREIYLMEGDFYLQGQRGDQGLRAFDMNKMLDEKPDYVLFNGGVGANTGANAFQARVGETVRIFFGVGGPNLTSSFHVIGEIFDRVYPEGALANPATNVQTTGVPAGGATVVEFKTEVPGTYSIVDHSLGRLEKGAAAQIVVQGEPNPEVFHSLHAGAGGSGGH